MDLMVELAETGFIPYGKYMKPFIPQIKFENWSAWKWNLEKKGYAFEEGEFGWLTVFKPMPERVGKPTGPMFNMSRELIEAMVTEVVNRVATGNK